MRRPAMLGGLLLACAVVAALFHSRGDYPSAISQGDGSFVMDGIPPGVIRFFLLDRELLEPQAFEVCPTNTEVVIRVAAMAAVRGRVVHDGAPVEGARVYASGQAVPPWARGTRSRADGSFELTGLKAGTFEIGAESRALGAYAVGVPVTLAKAEVHEGVVLDLKLAGSIAGRVVDQAGTPVAEVTVRVQLVGGRDFGLAITAGDGTFLARSLSGGGDYAVEVRPSGDSPLRFHPAQGDTFPTIAVLDGKTHVTGVELAVRVENLSISGRVVHDDGSPVADATVVAMPAKASGRHAYDEIGAPETRSAEDGTFVIGGLVAGRYALRARTGTGVKTEKANVAAGSENIVLRLPRGAAIDGALEGFTETPSVQASLGGEATYRAVVQGTSFSFEDLPPGRYVVAATTASEGDEAMVTLKPGRRIRVTLTSQGKARVNGFAFDSETRRPLQGVECFWTAEKYDLLFARAGVRSPVDVLSAADGAFSLGIPAAKDVYVACVSENTEPQLSAGAHVWLQPGATGRVEVVFKRREAPVQSHEMPWVGIDFGAQAAPTVIGRVVPGGPAATAGLVPGDRILRVDDTLAEDLDPMTVGLLLVRREVGDVVRITIERGGTARTVEVRLMPKPASHVSER